jgi:hypothetical protein
MKNRKLWKGVFYGIAYGIVSRAIFSLEDFREDHPNPVFATYGLMTFSFMFIVPFVVGLIVAYNSEAGRNSTSKIMTTAVFAVIGLVVFAVSTGSEGTICAFMALPVFIVMALIGGFIGDRIFKRNKNRLYVSALALLPFIIAPIEYRMGLRERIFVEHTQVDINCGATDVWDNITRVKKIAEAENHYSLFQFMGFPRPVEAELDTVAVGGIRKALFTRGLFFTETVTSVKAYKTLAFTIRADPTSIPPTALDEHVTVGGKYFDVLEGKYEIEETGKGKIILHLTSQFRLSTPFNFYSGLWSKILMKDIQKNILQIIKERSEKKSRLKSLS